MFHYLLVFFYVNNLCNVDYLFPVLIFKYCQGNHGSSPDFISFLCFRLWMLLLWLRQKKVTEEKRIRGCLYRQDKFSGAAGKRPQI